MTLSAQALAVRYLPWAGTPTLSARNGARMGVCILMESYDVNLTVGPMSRISQLNIWLGTGYDTIYNSRSQIEYVPAYDRVV
jgi:hypothetical protein